MNALNGAKEVKTAETSKATPVYPPQIFNLALSGGAMLYLQVPGEDRAVLMKQMLRRAREAVRDGDGVALGFAVEDYVGVMRED